MSYKPEVQTNSTGKWYSNALCFATEDEAYQNARNLARRWMAVSAYRAVTSDHPVTHVWTTTGLRQWPLVDGADVGLYSETRVI